MSSRATSPAFVFPGASPPFLTAVSLRVSRLGPSPAGSRLRSWRLEGGTGGASVSGVTSGKW